MKEKQILGSIIVKVSKPIRRTLTYYIGCSDDNHSERKSLICTIYITNDVIFLMGPDSDDQQSPLGEKHNWWFIQYSKELLLSLNAAFMISNVHF